MLSENEIKVLDLLTKLKNTSGSKAKASIIQEGKDNAVFLAILKFLNDINKTTGLALKKINKPVNENPKETIDSLTNAIVYVLNNNTGKDTDIATIQKYLETIDESYHETIKEILTKTFKCGVTAKSINSALGETLIPIFACQLAHPFEKHAEKVAGKAVYVTNKLDGHRMLCLVSDGGSITFYSRKGLEIDGLNELRNEIKTTLESMFGLEREWHDHIPDGLVLDGEAILDVPVNAYQETSKVLRKDGEKVGVHFHIFDTLTIKEFYAGKSNEPYKTRRLSLDIFNDALTENTSHLHVLPLLYLGEDLNIVSDILRVQIDQGEEGIMINLADGLYECKRTSNLLKMKEFFNADVLVIDMYEGTGKYKGMMGGVIIEATDPETGEKFNVSVGSGFNDSHRVEFWNNRDLIIGQIIDVQYFEITRNQKDGISFRFPTFKGVRFDKTEDDINVEG